MIKKISKKGSQGFRQQSIGGSVGVRHNDIES